MYCQVELLGRLGNEPEIKECYNGMTMVKFSVATNTYFKDKNGERQTNTEWHTVLVFNQFLIELAANYLHKGSMVFITGTLKTSKYERNGMNCYSTSVVVSNSKHQIKLLDKRELEKPEYKDKIETTEEEAQPKQLLNIDEENTKPEVKTNIVISQDGTDINIVNEEDVKILVDDDIPF